MPRKERTVARRSIVGAAKMYTPKKRDDRDYKRTGEEWQSAGWDFYDTIPEFGQAAVIQGALLSRAKLLVEERDEDGIWRPTKNPVAQAALDELFGGEEGQADMLRLLGIHLTVAGEGWLISPPLDKISEAEADEWTVAAATETVKSGGTWRVNGKELSGTRFGLRIWRAHPANRKKADAPTRRLLGDLSEMLQLKKRVAAQIDSRLSGAGVWLIPAETSFPSQPVQATNPGDPPTVTDSVAAGDAQGLADLLMERAKVAIQNPDSAEAMIPVIGEVPGEYMEKIREPITFWSELDKAAPQLRQELRETIARGMDIPVEVLLGGQGSNHWNMWLSDENNIKVHAEPALKIITTGLTTQYLRRVLDEESGVDDPKSFRIGADTAQMRLRPNRSKEALELNDRLILSDEAAIRENGFTDEDLMDDAGIKRALLRKVASGSTTPELVAAALRELGVDVPEIQDHRPPAEARPTPSLREHPVRDLPERQEPQAASLDGLVFAAEQMVDRALQRAGNKLKTKHGLRDVEIPANRIYMSIKTSAKDIREVLHGAWDCVQVGDYGVPSEDLARALDLYTRSLLTSRRQPDRASLAASLKLLMDRSAA